MTQADEGEEFRVLKSRLAAREKRMREVAEQMADARREVLALRNHILGDCNVSVMESWAQDIADQLEAEAAKLLEGLEASASKKEDAG